MGPKRKAKIILKSDRTEAQLEKIKAVHDSWNKDYAECVAKGKRIRNSGLHPNAVYKHPPQPGTVRYAM